MTNADYPLGERVVAVETDIKHMLDSIVRIEGGVGRIENVVIKETTERLEAGVARLENVVVKDATERLEAGLNEKVTRLDDRITETRDELKADIARVEGRIVETKEDYQRGVEVLLAAMNFNKTAVYVMCGTVIVGIVAALMRGTLF
ncbi:MAG: hypothetical protein F4029_00945 [Gammaproteobacteria bacterium]|nr:hypothetical protein [Gammaproteobacteria bacterium]